MSTPDIQPPRTRPRRTRAFHPLLVRFAAPRIRQRAFEFIERPERMFRKFKWSIALGTLLLVGLILGSSASGRNLVRMTATRGRWIAIRAVGLTPDRAEIDADWRRRRLHDLEQTRGKLTSTYSEYSRPMQRLLDYAGLDPAHALLRWGNFDRTLLLPSTVFESDDTGRSYRFRPFTRCLWVRNLKLKNGILAYFPVPDMPQLGGILQETGALAVPGSFQTTNSLGLRGPEPNLAAALRGIVLGDSYMQGLFVGDDQTPSECLKRALRCRFHTQVEILNTGHLGYSSEQEYFTLREYVDRIKPQFVILSIFANDFGDLFEVLEGRGDWEEGSYWLAQITQFCRSRGLICLAVPAPWVNQVDGQRKAGHYPGRVSNILESNGLEYLDPIDDFVDEHLRQLSLNLRAGRPTTPSPLFNGKYGDGHFSPLGCEVWARTVARRLVLLLERARDEMRVKF